MIAAAKPAPHQVSYQQTSLRYPYSITLFGPQPAALAIVSLPAQLPLALLLSALIGYVVWLATANRMSLSGKSVMALTPASLSCIASR